MSALLRHYYSITRKPADHWLGYTVAVSGALMQMMSYGIDNSFSIFSTSMQEDPTLGYPSATAVSFGNSVSLGLSPVFGLIAGFMVDRLPPRLMMFISTAVLFLGLWISSTCAKSMVAVAFSYCLLASISSACMLSPGAAATGSWFKKRLGLAQGINFCGGGIGSAVIPAVLGHWVDPYGWRKTFRLMSIFCSIGLFASIFSCRRGIPVDEEESTSGSQADGSVLQDLEDIGSPVMSPNEGYTKKVYESAEVASRGKDNGSQSGASNDENALTKERGLKATAAGEPSASGAVADSVEVEPTAAADAEPRDAAALSDELPQETPGAADGDEPQNEGLTRTVSRHDVLFEIMHTRRLSPVEILRSLLTVEFLANFFMFVIYGWAFYGLIYVTVPYVSSMGVAGTVYAHVTPISTSKASTVFTFWGAFQVIGSVLVGALASVTSNAFAYCLCSGVGGVATAALVFCRTYAAFAACTSVVGFCTAGMFAMMPALVVESFYGPNIGFFMACVFLAGCVGGFSSPPMQAQMQTTHHGNYSYGCIVISVCMTVPGLICYVCLWPRKRSLTATLTGKLRKKVHPSTHV